MPKFIYRVEAMKTFTDRAAADRLFQELEQLCDQVSLLVIELPNNLKTDPHTLNYQSKEVFTNESNRHLSQRP